MVLKKFFPTVTSGMMSMMLDEMLRVTNHAGTGPPLSFVIAVKPPKIAHDQKPMLARL